MNIGEFEGLARGLIERREAAKNVCITVCSGTGCRACGGEEVVRAFAAELENLGLTGTVELRDTGCHGFCERGPIVVILPEGIFYQRVTVDAVPEIIEQTVRHGKLIERLLYEDPQSKEKVVYEKDVPFYKRQHRLVLANNLLIDPTSIEDYISIGGYQSLVKALAMQPEEIIEIIKRSGLRGRGGAGFPTGRKWEHCRRAKGTIKYVICNGDEGDPGAYMDRSVMEGNPHSVIEGMIIGAYAIGANEGWIYVRNEYPLAVKHLTRAVEQARELGILAGSVLGLDFPFDVRIAKGAGAFVCGEGTALIASIEGKIGVPRQRPPRTTQQGLFGKPTNMNNVETWANVPLIIDKGAEWFSSIGTETSKGTKIFSLVGKVQNTGLVEVPMGATLAQIVYDIGGGAPNGRDVKAIQIGGPSGGCLPKELFYLPIDYDSLVEAGAMMGSGGLIVMDEDTCMVDVARYFSNFLQEESCGKCVTCREGTQRMYEILTDITEGRGKEEDLDLLEELGATVRDASLCGLGQTAPNPVLSTMRYFRGEYLAHITEKRCPAGVCRALTAYRIDPDRCTGCMLCKKQCPQQAIEGERKKPHTIVQDACIRCRICFDVCKVGAVMKTGVEVVHA